jgi:hypothetical protein
VETKNDDNGRIEEDWSTKGKTDFMGMGGDGKEKEEDSDDFMNSEEDR